MVAKIEMAGKFRLLIKTQHCHVWEALMDKPIVQVDVFLRKVFQKCATCVSLKV